MRSPARGSSFSGIIVREHAVKHATPSESAAASTAAMERASQ